MQTPIEFAMTFLLNALWQVPLIALAAVLCARLLKGVSPRYSYRVWVAALVLALLLPVLTSVSISQLFQSPITSVAEPSEKLVTESFYLPAAEPLVGETPPNSFFRVPIVLAFLIFTAYALLVLYRSVDLLRAWIKTREIVRGAYRADFPESISDALEKCREAIGEQEAEVLFSDRVPVPITSGHRRPVVILPEHFLHEKDEDLLVTALGHELVHVNRRDYAFNLLFEITCLPLSFHPVTAYAKRQIAYVRELCCDEIVTTRLLGAEAYARSLLNIAGSAPPSNRLSPIITVGITDAENLEVRIMSLLKKSELTFRKKAFIITAAIILLSIPLAAAAFISPSVSVNSAGTQPEAQSTPPEKEESYERKTSREELERKLAEVKKAQADPNLTERQRVELGAMESKLEQKLAEADRVERLVRKVEEVKSALEDPNLSENQRNEYKAVEAKLKSELYKTRAEGDVGYAKTDEVIVNVTRSAAMDDDLKPLPNGDLNNPRIRAEMEKLKRSANISGEQAMEIALAAYPGKIVDKEVGQLKDEIAFTIFILDGTETPEGNAVMVVVSGVDGRVMKTERVGIKQSAKRRAKPE